MRYWSRSKRGRGSGQRRGGGGGGGPGPIEQEVEATAIRPWRVEPVTDDGGRQFVSCPGGGVQEARALGGAHPLVAIADVVGGGEGRDVDRKHSRPVGAVDEQRNRARLEFGCDAGGRGHEGGGAGEMGDQPAAGG